MVNQTVPPVGVRHRLLRRVVHVVGVLAVALAGSLVSSPPVHAAEPELCTVGNGCLPPTTLPSPELLYLEQGGQYLATAAQKASLRALENEAVQTVMDFRSLPSSDDGAVRTWGRDDVLAQLYLLFVGAIETPAAERSADQQNAVEWVQTVAKRRTVASASNAAREYVKWAGLGRSNFDALMRTEPTEAELLAFLSGTVVNYDDVPPNATEGWCAYRSPTPYAAEYQGYNNPVCSGPVIGFVLPPTPSYEQFVQWGAAKATYLLLSNAAYSAQAKRLGAAMGFAIPFSVVVSAAATYVTAAHIVTATARVAHVAQIASRITGTAAQGISFSAAVGSLIVASVSLALTILAAVATAILVGIDVTNAANLPGKLASLVATALTTTPDVSTLTETTDSSLSLLSILVGATTPAPILDTCDNSLMLDPGMYEITVIGSDTVTLTSSTPCLNPTPIPDPVATDSVWLVTDRRSGATTSASTIDLRGESGGATSVRLSNSWFITDTNGTEAQTLRIEYTDWSGTVQNAWLIADSEGYSFLTFAPPSDASSTVDPETCVDDGTCGVSSTIEYIGADRNQYSASVRRFQPPTGTPVIDPPVQATPATFDANGFAPGGATAPITYRWDISLVFCGLLACDPFATVTGATPTYTWARGGDYDVTLTATDGRGVTASTTLRVYVTAAAPSLSLLPSCSGAAAPTCSLLTIDQGSSIALRGTATYVGASDGLRAFVDWGDGTSDILDLNPSGFRFPSNSPMTFTPIAGQQAYSVLAAHPYAAAGTYQGTLRVANLVGFASDGPSATMPFTVTAIGSQTITFPSPGGSSYGNVFGISATGGPSGQPVTFTAIGGCTLSDMVGGTSTGSATVTITSVGTCNITARQAGSAGYRAAPDVTRSVTSLLALLTVQASSETIDYGDPFPTITPSYSGFRLNDTEAVVTTDATCTIAPTAGPAGVYATNCSGALANSYTFVYVPGTLSIRRAVLTARVGDATMIRGDEVPEVTVTYSGFIGDDDESDVSAGFCFAIDNEGSEVTSNTETGTYPISCSGGTAANYLFDYVAGTLTIRNPGDATVPAAPSGVDGSATAGTVNLAWTDASIDEDGFTVQRARWNGAQFVEWASFTVPANAEGFSQAVPDGLYAYLVSSFNAAGSSESGVVLIDSTTAAAPPSVPTGIAAVSTPSAIEVTWNDTSSDEFGFEIMRARLVGDSWRDWRAFVADRDVESFVDPDPIDGDYAYLVRSFNPLGSSEWAITTVTRSTAAVPPAPGAPTATADVDDVTVSWIDGSTDELRFDIARARYNPTTDLWGEWTYFAAEADATSFVDVAVPDGQYVYAVRAVNSLGASAWEYTGIVLVSDPFELPAAPANVRITQRTADLLVEWDDLADNEVTYEVTRAQFDGSQWTGWTSWPLDKDSTEFADASAPPGTVAYLVRTSNAVGTSDWALATHTPING